MVPRQWHLRYSFFFVFFVSSLLGLVLPAAHAAPQIKFSNTAAAQAFLAKQYDQALAEFQKLRATNPNNTLVLRYLAISLDKLGRYDEAIAVFNEALAVAPNKPALRFHLGVTYYNARRAAAAKRTFEQVLQLAPDTRYAEVATRYLQVIAEQQAQQQRPGKPDRFSVFAQTAWRYDDNVPSAPDDGFDGERRDSRVSAYLSLRYYLLQSSKGQVSVEINGYGSRYSDETFQSLETAQYNGELRLQRNGTLGKTPYTGSATYDYTEVRLTDGGDYSRTHALSLGLRLNFSANSSTKVHYRYANDAFVDEGFDPAFSSRDAAAQTVGLRHTVFFAKRQGQVFAEVEYEDNEANGVNFVMDGTKARIGTIIPLPWEIKAEFDVSYSADDYTRFAGPVRRETDSTAVNVGLSRWIRRRFLIKLDYSVLDVDSTIEQLAYQRKAWGLSVSYVN